MKNSTIVEVVAPKINNNEDTVTLIQCMENYQFVGAGDLLGVVESTKATYEVTAPCKGYVYTLYTKGQAVQVGDVLFLVLSEKEADLTQYRGCGAAVGERLISQKAQSLLVEHKIDQTMLPGDGVISAQLVSQYIAECSAAQTTLPEIKKNSLLIYSAGNHAEVVYEAVEAAGVYEVLGFVDYSGLPQTESLFGLPVFSRFQLDALLAAGIDKVHVNSNDFKETRRVADTIKSYGGLLISVIHPSAVVSPSAILEENVFIGANAVIGTNVSIGAFSKVLNCASVAHHSGIGQNTQISDGARVAGSVSIGNHCLIGLGATVNMKLQVCDDVTVASGVNLYSSITKAGFITQ